MLTGKTALITGSTGGIGHGTADALAAQGCRVMLNGLGDPDENEAIRAALQAKHGVEIGFHGADLRNLSEIEDLAATTERELGPDHRDMAQLLEKMAGLRMMEGRYGEAEPLYLRAITIREETLGPNHPDLALTLETYAGLLRLTGRTEEAEALEARAAAILGN